MSEIVSYKCPNCGASIPFDANSGKLKCAHCGTEYDVSTLKDLMNEENIGESNVTFSSKASEKVNIEDKVTYTCPSCGGQVVGDKDMSASVCPYCGNALIDSKQFDGILKPEIVVPFALDINAAKRAYSEFLKGKFALPSDFEASNVIEKLNGLYVPYWLFDARVNAKGRFRATRVKNYRQGDYMVTETSHYLVYRDGSASFEKVPVDASSKLDDSLLDALEPFDLTKGTDFNSAYLSGYFADRYDQEKETSYVKASERINNSMAALLSSSVVGYSSYFLENASFDYQKANAYYALLPVYIFSTKYHGKVYNFAMNGQTGKFAGDLPMDGKKVASLIAIIFVACFIIIGLITYFLVK